MKIEDLRKICTYDRIQMTFNVLQRCRERTISIDDIINCIMNGEIIEDYPNDYPFPSALIMECSAGKPLHIVVGTDGKQIWIVTAYVPDSNKWENNYKTRKVN